MSTNLNTLNYLMDPFAVYADSRIRRRLKYFGRMVFVYNQRPPVEIMPSNKQYTISVRYNSITQFIATRYRLPEMPLPCTSPVVRWFKQFGGS